MARVRGVMAARTAAGSMFRVSGSTSTSTGRAPTCSITFTEAVKVSGVVMTSSPAPTPSVASAVCRPAVHELSASAPGASRDAANSVSKRLVFGPVVIQSERSVSTTSRISSSPMTGGANGRNSVRRAGARVSDTGAPRPFRRWRMWGRRPRRPRARTRAGAASGSRGWRAHARGQERSFARLPRHVLRHEARNGVDQLVARAVGQGLEEVLEITLYRRSVRSVALDDADLVVGGGDGVLGARDELLGEFLAGAQAAERDRDVAVGLEAR